jgi:hypothetical protein
MSDIPPVVKDKTALPFIYGWPAYIEETGVEIRGHNWGTLKQLVGKYLDANKLDVGDRELYLNKAVCIALTRAGKGAMCIRPYKLSAAASKTHAYEMDPRMPKNLRRGPGGYDARAWGVWHMAAWDGKLNGNYARELVARIGCGSCRSHVVRVMMKTPIPNDHFDAFRWTVDFHNEVNKRLRKKTVTYDEAKAFWHLEP